MITIIFAPPRTGKTALMTKFALERMSGTNARQALKACGRILEPLNNNGFGIAPPTVPHLVFSDYAIVKDSCGKIMSNEVDGFRIGLPNKQHKTLFIPPFSDIFLDEAQKYLNSRRKIATFVSRFYELHGQFYMNIMFAAQRPALIDLNVRELAAKIIEVREMEHEYKHGLLVRTQWNCREFENCAAAIRYIESGKTENIGERNFYRYDGNIFKHYNANNFFPFLFKNRYEVTHMDIMPAQQWDLSLLRIKKFNLLHDFEVPSTYYEVN